MGIDAAGEVSCLRCKNGFIVMSGALLTAVFAFTAVYILKSSRIDHLSDEEIQIIKFILHEIPRTAPDASEYFLTSSSRENDWNQSGLWKSLPNKCHEELTDSPVTFRPAAGAKMVSQQIIDKQTGESAWMRWVSIRKWESPTEVIVEEGLRGGTPSKEQGSILFLSKSNGDWKIDAVCDRWMDVLTENGWELE